MVEATGAAPATSSSPRTARQTGQAEVKGGFANSDFETFLKMLTTQIRNQDPLNPMEGSEFAVQLATFSGVEQQVQTNTLLREMLGTQAGGALARYGDWIGRQVRTTGPVHFGDAPIEMALTPRTGADDAILVAMDAAGRRVAEDRVGAGAGRVDWFGRDDAGNRLPAGIYSFTLESLRGGEVIGSTPVASYAVVEEVQSDADGISLILQGGVRATPDQIEGLAAR
ncbi:flagellar basal-body rod modification protein FlgD [Paracoccus isoporae]|uniref:Basal-body rod modification protein FlgD n=1 Tax=Paracoccus isoporae TaxID=591205 RepID=A0A1G6YL39_9RHOB|nr:flagellar hook capping FlgD N-terminal domain-containing protein [Paracoccus isoporae]SDD91011.1 flagellar basal-body rod modification protein FlgD [Paracoccus isoporae]